MADGSAILEPRPEMFSSGSARKVPLQLSGSAGCLFPPKDGKNDLVVDFNLIKKIVVLGIFRVVRILYETIVGYNVARKILITRIL